MRINLTSTQKRAKPLLSLPDLTILQKHSYNTLIEEGINDVLHDINPIMDYTGRNWELTFSNPKFDKPICSVSDAIAKGLTYEAPWYLETNLTDTKSKKSKAN